MLLMANRFDLLIMYHNRPGTGTTKYKINKFVILMINIHQTEKRYLHTLIVIIIW